MCFDYDEHPDVYQEKITRARKHRKCRACGDAIAVGELYFSVTVILHGDCSSHSSCRRCSFDTLRVVAHELDDGCDHGNAWPDIDDLIEHLDESDLGQTEPDAVPEWFREWLESAYRAKALDKFQQESIDRLRSKDPIPATGRQGLWNWEEGKR